MASLTDSDSREKAMTGAHGAAVSFMEGLQNEIPPEKIARRINDMLEATCVSPAGITVTDWRTVEAGVKLYLNTVRHEPANPPPFLQGYHHSRAEEIPATATAVREAAPSNVIRSGGISAAPPPVADEIVRKPVEPYELMRRKLVMEPHALALKRGAESSDASRKRQGEGAKSASLSAGAGPAGEERTGAESTPGDRRQDTHVPPGFVAGPRGNLPFRRVAGRLSASQATTPASLGAAIAHAARPGGCKAIGPSFPGKRTRYLVY